MDVRVRLLGSPAISVGETVHEPPPGRLAALLYYLAYRATWVRRDELLYVFWPDTTEARARASLRTLLIGVRRSGLAPTLEVERTRLRWLVASDLSDPLERSAATLLDGFRITGAHEFDAWLDLERTALDDRRRGAILMEVDDALAAGRQGDAVALLDRWLLAQPLDEHALLRLVTLALETGRNEEALDRYRSFAARLGRDLDLEPSPRLRDAYEALRSARGPVGLDDGTPAPAASPAGGGGVTSGGFVGIDEVLVRSAQLGFLPLLLEALVLAADLVPLPLRERVRALAVRHAATAGPVRLRPELVPSGARPRDLTGWDAVAGIVVETRHALATVGGDAASSA